MNITITKQESIEAKQKGWTADQLRIYLFTNAIQELSEFQAIENAIFKDINYNTRIFPFETIQKYISDRSIIILKHNNILQICGSGYQINNNAIPNNINELNDIAEVLIWG